MIVGVPISGFGCEVKDDCSYHHDSHPYQRVGNILSEGASRLRGILNSIIVIADRADGYEESDCKEQTTKNFHFSPLFPLIRLA